MPETYSGRYRTGNRRRGNRYAPGGNEKKSFSKKVLLQSVCAVLILLAVYCLKGVDNQSVKVVREQIKLTLNQSVSIPRLDKLFGGETVEEPDEPEQDDVQEEPETVDVDEAIPVNIDEEDDIIVQL